MLNGALTPTATGLVATPSGANSMLGMNYDNDAFDTQFWTLDALLDFNYTSFATPLEGS
jgi:hypothetical protein